MDKRLVRVTWADAADPDNGEESAWFSDAAVDAFSNQVCEVVSVGWLKSESKLYYTLVADYIINGDDTITWGRPTKIPRGMASKIETLGVLENVKIRRNKT